jgi:1,2-diacylglycerol 3-beta-glucosyltransferase
VADRPPRIAAAADLALAGVNVALSLPVVYLGGLTVVAAIVSHRRRTPVVIEAPITRFVVIVPAHNEATTLPSMLASLAALDYPSSLVAIHVVADNCDDSTADIAHRLGAIVHERTDSANPGKGPALNWLVERLVERDESFDAAVFVDADTTVSSGFLRAFDRRLRAGAVAVQGNYGVREAFESTPAALRYCALACRHHARPLARTAIGGSCGLFGNAMAFRRDLVLDRRWTDHLVEDMEFQIELLLDGTHVEYEPDARVEAEMPHTFAASVSQHQRWEVGRVDMARRFVPRLLRRLVRPGPPTKVAVADSILDMATPPLSMLALASVASGGAGATSMLFAPTRLSRVNAFVGFAFVTTVCAHALVALRLVDAPPRAYRALLSAPKLAAWKLLLLMRSFTGVSPPAWTRTRRNAEARPTP